MIEMTLSSRHRIRNSSPGGLRPSTLPLGHGGSPQYWLSHVDGEETFFVSFKPPRPGTEPRSLAWKAAVLTTTLGPPPSWYRVVRTKASCFSRSVHLLKKLNWLPVKFRIHFKICTLTFRKKRQTTYTDNIDTVYANRMMHASWSYLDRI